MLEIRPNCELCDCDLPAQSKEARICSYECTYCANCVDTILHDVCPKCGGNFVPRPIRPAKAYRTEPKLGLENQPASNTRVQTKYSKEEIVQFTNRLRYVAADER